MPTPRYAIRTDTAANWTSTNPVLADGEFGYETDSPRVKIGDGSTAWTSLAYLGGDAINGKFVGEVFSLLDKRATAAGFPAVRLTDAAQTLAAANYPLLVTYLRAIPVEVEGYTTFTGTAAAAVLTLADTSAGDGQNEALLAALVEDELFDNAIEVFGTRVLTIGATDYTIEDISIGDNEITLSSAPPAGATTCSVYAYRTLTATTARLAAGDGLVLANAGRGGELVAGLRRRDHGQRLQGYITRAADSAGIVNKSSAGEEGALKPRASDSLDLLQSFESVNGVGIEFDSAYTGSRVDGDYTEPRALVAHSYIWAGTYSA